MVSLVIAVVATVLIGVGLWSSQRGEGNTVVGAGNAFDAYYGKKKGAKADVGPCPDCIRMGCIGAGECRCLCHLETRITRGPAPS